MKKNTIIGIVFCIIGGVIFLVALGLVGMNFARLSIVKSYTSQTSVYENINSDINLDIISGKVHIVKATDNQIKVEYQTNDKEYYEISTDNGISFKEVQKYNVVERMFVFYYNKTMTVHIPQGYSGSIKINGMATSVEVSGISVVNINIEVASGGISLSNVKASNNVVVKSFSGQFTSNGVQANRFELEAASGSVDISDTLATTLIVKSFSGTTKLTRVQADTIDIDSTSGSVDISDTLATTLIVKSFSGTTKLTRVQADTIDIDSTSGSIYLSVIGIESEYSIDIKQVSGSSNVSDKSGTTDKKISLDVVSGSIEVLFVTK